MKHPVIGQDAVVNNILGEVTDFRDTPLNRNISFREYISGDERSYPPDEVKLVAIEYADDGELDEIETVTDAQRCKITDQQEVIQTKINCIAVQDAAIKKMVTQVNDQADTIEKLKEKLTEMRYEKMAAKQDQKAQLKSQHSRIMNQAQTIKDQADTIEEKLAGRDSQDAVIENQRQTIKRQRSTIKEQIKLTTEQPEEGQYICIYDYNGDVWALTCKWINEKLHYYCSGTDTWFLWAFEKGDNTVNVRYLV